MAGIDMPPELPTVITAADGITRCRWATETGCDLTIYHDVEWGTPTRDEVALFEALALMADDTIVRNRSKIEATVHNARVMSTFSWAQLVWEHEPRHHHRLRSWSDGRMASPESRKLAIALRGKGFRLVGPVVAHSFMQTVGIENGHLEGCARA